MGSLNPDRRVQAVALAPGEPLPQLEGIQSVGAPGVAGYPRNLAATLRDRASAWTVSTSGRWGLERVVDTVTKGAFAEVVATGTDAAALLAKAWAAVFSRAPHYDDGYRYAVLAVEAAAAQRTTPDDGKPTLGKESGHIKQTVARWTVAGLDADERHSGDTLLSMMQTLWHNHGLVQWFQRGLAFKQP